MGIFTQAIEVGSADLALFESVELLVDTGSTYTWLPRDLVARLRLTPSARRRVRLADGRVVERDGLDCPIRLAGETHSIFCLIADPGDSCLLGALTLETFSLGVDPVNRTLVPVVASAAGGP